jgi:hypothetical protein
MRLWILDFRLLADESFYWMEMLIEAGLVQLDRLDPLMREANEIIAILTAPVKTAQENLLKK